MPKIVLTDIRKWILTACIAMMVAPVDQAKAQTCKHQIGIDLANGSLYGGDISPNGGLRCGVTYMRNITERLSYGVACQWGTYGGDDKNSRQEVFQQRALKYDTEFIETSFHIDMTFVRYDYTASKAIAPYIGAAVAVLAQTSRSPLSGHWDKASDAYDVQKSRKSYAVSPALSLSVGVKAKICTRMAVDCYMRWICYLSDNVDFSYPDREHLPADITASERMVGSRSWDMAMCAGIRVSYLWGREPCYCR